MSAIVTNNPVVEFMYWSNLFFMILDLSKLSGIYSNGFIKHIAVTIAYGHSELDLHAYSAGLTSPNTNGPRLLINEKSCARLESSGLSNFPSPSTGMCETRPGRLYLSYLPARTPCRIIPASRSSHKTKLLLVYGADPYSACHQEGR